MRLIICILVMIVSLEIFSLPPKIIFQVNGKQKETPEFLKDLDHVNLNHLDDEIIERVLKDGTYHQVKLKRDGNIIYVMTVKPPIIQDVKFYGLGALSSFNFLNIIRSQINTELDEEKIKSDLITIENYLHRRGFPNSKKPTYEIETTDNDLFVKIKFYLDRGDPCRISEILLDNQKRAFLDLFNLNLSTGDVCDLNQIGNELDQKKIEFQKDGFLQAKVALTSIEYSKDGSTARIHIDIQAGARTVYRVKDEEDHEIISNFLDLDEKFSYSEIQWMNDEDMSIYINKYYRDQGYPDSSVTFVGLTEKTKPDLIEHLFSLKKGRRVFIKNVSFVESRDQDEEKFDQKKLLEFLELDSMPVPFVQEKLSFYQQLLINGLLSEGYSKAEVSYPRIRTISETSVELEFTVNPKKKFIIKDIYFIGLPEELHSKEDKITKTLNEKRLLTKENLDDLKKQTRSLLNNEGYHFAKIDISYSFFEENNENKVDVYLTIRGQQQIKISQVFVEGDTYDKDTRLIEISGLRIGDLYTPAGLEFARKQLLRHLFIADVSIDPLGDEASIIEKKQIALVIRIRTKKGFSFGVNPGFGSFYGYRVITSYKLYDLNSSGLNFLTKLSIFQNQNQLQFKLPTSNPNEIIFEKFLGYELMFQLNQPLINVGSWVSPVDAEVSAKYSAQNESISARFYQDYKVGLTMFDTLGKYNTRYSIDAIQELSTTIMTYDILNLFEPKNTNIREVGVSSEISWMDNPAWPQQGSLWRLSYSRALKIGNSNFTYDRIEFNGELYFPIVGDWSQALKFGGIKVMNTKSTVSGITLPPFSRRATYSGSEPVVRGYFQAGGGSIEPLLWSSWTGTGYCQPILQDLSSTNLIYLKYENRYKLSERIGLSQFIDSGVSFYTADEVASIKNAVNTANKQVSGNVNSSTDGLNVCKPNYYVFDSYVSEKMDSPNLMKSYLKYSYVSVGVGLSFIIKNLISMYINYGYPIRDPEENVSGCVTAQDSLSLGQGNAPKCIIRKQLNSVFFNAFKFYGAVNLGVSGQF